MVLQLIIFLSNINLYTNYISLSVCISVYIYIYEKTRSPVKKSSQEKMIDDTFAVN